MSELSQTATADAATGDHPLHPLVAGLRQRHAKLSARDGRARPFELRLPDRTAHLIGGEAIGGGGEPAFTVRIVTEKGLAAMAAFDELRVAEAYMDGDLDIEGDLLTALKLRPVLGDPHPLKYLFSTYVEPLLFGQVGRDKKWIKSHYDVDPNFFLLWLDGKLRAYSHGFFESDDESLEAGMERKFRYAFDACGIQPGQRVLDIGGGWGSFLEFAGEQGVHVTSITISDESEKTMRDLIRRRGLACEVVKEHFLEYRLPPNTEPFDAIVNLGVTEHLPDYRRTLAQYERLLKPGRRVYLDAYSGARHGMPSFISKWVFQGNTSPLCLERYLTEVARTPFEVVVIKNDRHNYFLSCKKWAENLEAKRDEVIARWGKHLYRRFVLYLWSAANSFETGTLSAHHMILQLPAPGSAPRAAMESWS
ncbi:MAG: cyclopropane-fatty-acyl-phospholipid synthase [Acidobacteriota bacterium]|jgi:cyclopropane-fatty-acyl-phospholipid synthase|nr:cyclopropane-fatty-acyl-phospholipid synthase [Acidobacteriota bacterium]